MTGHTRRAHADEHAAEQPADSAGIPFGGREITSTGFDGDTGVADAELLRLLDHGDESAWMAHLAKCRLLVPIVAAPAEVDESGPLAVEKETDMAVVTLTAPDGTTALPVFTSIDALARWNPDARPTPVTAARAAQAAISERCDVMLLDLRSPQHVVLRTSMVWALAQQQVWVPVDRDPVVAAGVARALAGRDVVHGHALEDAGEGALRIRIRLAAGLDQEDLQALATSVGEQLATDGEMRARIEGLAFAFEQA